MLMPIKRLLSRILSTLNMSIRLKILVIFVLSAIMPLGILGIISYNSYFNMMQQTVSNNTSELANQLNRNLELFFSNMNIILDAGEETLVINYLNENDPDAKYEYAKEIGVRFDLFRNIYNENIVQDINIIGLSGNSISNRRGVYQFDLDLQKNPIYRRSLSDPQKLHIFVEDTVYSQMLRRIDSTNMISISKVIRLEVTREVKGLILVDIERKLIEDICSNIKLGDTGNFIVTDQEWNYIYYPELQLSKSLIKSELIPEINQMDEGYFVTKLNGEKYFIVYNNLELLDWKIIGIVKLSEIMNTALEIRKWTIIMELFLVAGVVLLFILITRTMTLPIRDLRRKMEMAESGNLDVEATYAYNDEISDLSKGFNQMLANIRELLAKNEKQQENLKKLEFKSLQAQINPHFLYNTLDAIVWTAEADRKEEVVDIAKNLSTFFRVALSKGKEWILVEDEILHIESYLSIQKVRYRDILEYELDIEPKIMNYSILKLVLQPLVENALYHGLKNKRGGGKILITGKILNKHMIIFEVSDNGTGMSEEKLQQVNKEIQREEQTVNINTGFGLMNVNQRIKLYYGAQYGLSIKSTFNEGTTVQAILPVIRKRPTPIAVRKKG
jgi:two-component system, sensor histidine kinase YesM